MLFSSVAGQFQLVRDSQSTLKEYGKGGFIGGEKIVFVQLTSEVASVLFRLALAMAWRVLSLYQ